MALVPHEVPSRLEASLGRVPPHTFRPILCPFGQRPPYPYLRGLEVGIPDVAGGLPRDALGTVTPAYAYRDMLELVFSI